MPTLGQCYKGTNPRPPNRMTLRMIPATRRRLFLLAGLGLAAAVGLGLTLRLSRQVRAAFAATPRSAGPLQFAELPGPPFPATFWGGGEVRAVAAAPSSLLTAGAFGVADESGLITDGLPSLRATALTLWRGHPVAGLASGGLFLRREGRWQEARSSFSTLEVRALLEGPGGELWIGARQGLFWTAWASTSLEQVDAAPVKALALGPGGALLAGGEQGLKRIVGRTATAVATPDPWIDWVGVQGSELLVLTPLGLARGPWDGPLAPLQGGQEIRSAAQAGTQVFAVAPGRMLRFDPSGRPAEEWLPVPPLRVFANSGLVFADTDQGLFRRSASGWTLARPRPLSLPPGPSHVNALALWKGQVALGLFDGGLLLGDGQADRLVWKAVPESSPWGVNALLGAEAVLYIASLRGAVRWDGRRAAPLGAGSAYALAQLADGVAIGYGHGVQLPDGRLLSAFHGLPGNQALALEGGAALFVGTPSGLGAVSDRRVAWRVTAGDGKLPNPWVTALATHQNALYIGTYGGGVARRNPEAGPGSGAFEPFAETRGFKINPGCLRVAGGRLYLGTEGRGLWRLSEDGSRFAPLRAPLPSPRITALLQNGSYLLAGTDEGLALLPLSLLREGS